MITDPVFEQHSVPEGHPEQPDRLRALLHHWQTQPQLQGLSRQHAQPATLPALAAVHSSTHLERLQALSPTQGLAYVDPDTVMSPQSLNAACHAAGALSSAVQVVLSGAEQQVFCAVRPPGHHAERDNGMGFCLYNSVAVGARQALAQPGLERVAILDFDVHHGNGTVDIFRDDPRVLVCSSFQHPFYPHRQADVAGTHLVHTPLAAGTDGAAFRLAIERDWLPALAQHRPDVIFVSAGFDAHANDPLAALQLRSTDFAWLGELIADSAGRYSQGRIISTLEGGYDLQALCDSATAYVLALMGAAAPVEKGP